MPAKKGKRKMSQSRALKKKREDVCEEKGDRIFRMERKKIKMVVCERRRGV